MAQTNYTPISLYFSTTAAAVPTSGNLVAGELALNTLDEKLYFKNSAGTVKLLASSAAAAGVTSVAMTVPTFLSVAGSPITSSGTLAVTLSGTALPIANGGTGATTLAGANIAVTNAAQTFTGGQRGAVTVLTSSSASIAINLATNCNFSYTTTENSTLAAPSNPVAGQSGVIIITQGATAYTLAYNTFYKFAGGTVPTLTATASAVDTFAYYVESATRATCQLIKDVK